MIASDDQLELRAKLKEITPHEARGDGSRPLVF